MTVKTLEQYLAEWEAKIEPHQRDEARDRCESCGEREPLTSDGTCRECLRYHYGYDQAEEELVEGAVGGAVQGALRAGAPPELVMVTVHRAMQRHQDEVTDSAILSLARAVGAAS